MPHTNANVLRDKEGVPIPQYFDVLEGVFKPLTTEGYPGQKVSVENHPEQIDEVTVKNFPLVPTEITVNNLPTVQDVNITNPADPVEFPDVQKVTVENHPEPVRLVGVNNFPPNQQVTVTNQKEVQKVKDEDVNTRLLAIEQTNASIVQSNAAILDKLNGVLDTQVTGSIVAKTVIKNRSDGKTLTVEPGVTMVIDTLDISANTNNLWVSFAGFISGSTAKDVTLLLNFRQTGESDSAANTIGYDVTSVKNNTIDSSYALASTVLKPVGDLLKVSVKNAHATASLQIYSLTVYEEQPKGVNEQ